MSTSERSVEERLSELQRESERRSRELREIAAQLPSAVSRRGLVRAMATGLSWRAAVEQARRATGRAYGSIGRRLRELLGR